MFHRNTLFSWRKRRSIDESNGKEIVLDDYFVIFHLIFRLDCFEDIINLGQKGFIDKKLFIFMKLPNNE